MVPIDDREEEVLDAPREEKPGMVAVEGGVIEEVPDRRIVHEGGRGSTLDQWEVSLIGPVMGEAEEPVQKQVCIRLTQDQKELPNLRGSDDDEVMIRWEKVGVQSFVRRVVISADVPMRKAMRKKGASEIMISIRESPART